MHDRGVSASPYATAIRQWLGRPVWATVAASVVLCSAYVFAVVAALSGWVPWWAGAITCFVCAHAGASIMHEASHRAISGGAKGLGWLDQLLGSLHAAMLLYDFPIFRHLHLRHHANTNIAANDPDYWLQQHTALQVAFRGLFVPMHYVRLYFLAARNGEVPRTAAILSLVRVVGLFSIMVALLIVAPLETYILWIAPSAIASALLSLAHRMLHASEVSRDHRRTTRLVIGDGVWEWLMCPFFWLNNHHLIHHESPRLPAIAHKGVFTALEPELVASGAQIVRLGARPKS